MYSRRLFSCALIGALCALTASSVVANPPPSNIPDEYKTSGFALGCQAWTFNHFTVLEAIEKTHEAGGKVIEFFPGQRLRADQPAVTFSHNSPEPVIEQVEAQLKKYNILAVNYGVVVPGGRTAADRDAEWDKIFAFAHRLKLVGVTSEPNPADMDKIESLVNKYNLRFCIHDHPKQPNHPDYQFWSPWYVASLVKGRDSRMGSCADIGHWVRSGVKPMEALHVLEGRIMSSHLKDLNEFGNEKAHDMPYGTGVSDVKGILDELKRQGFDGNISIEYEYHMDHPLPEVKECVKFVREYGQGK
jgi:sugar phosphate isomerase/epimerase